MATYALREHRPDLVAVVSRDWKNPANRILPLDLFLFDHWDTASSESVATQRIRLFQEYIDLGHRGRLSYYVRARTRDFPLPTELQVENILKIVRTAWEREVAGDFVFGSTSRAFLRLDYDGEFDTDHTGTARVTGANSPYGFLTDLEKHNFGDDWERVLLMYPEIIDSLQEPLSDEDRQDPIKDRLHIQEHYDLFSNDPQLQAKLPVLEIFKRVTGHLLIQDSQADRKLPPGAGLEFPAYPSHINPDRGNLRYLWLDEYGSIVREGRCSYGFAFYVTSVIQRGHRDRLLGLFEETGLNNPV